MQLLFKYTLFCIFFLLSRHSFCQSWIDYSDSTLFYFKRNNVNDAKRTIKIVDSLLLINTYPQDTSYADYLYRKAVVNSSIDKPDTLLLKKALSIWKKNVKGNILKEMKIYYFLGVNYFSLAVNSSSKDNYDSSYFYYSNCFKIINNYSLEDESIYLGILNTLSKICYYQRKDYRQAYIYSKHYTDYVKISGVKGYDFDYVDAYKFQQDSTKAEDVLVKYLNNYIESNDKNPDILFKIYFELTSIKYINNDNILKYPLEIIKYGEKAINIYEINKFNYPLQFSNLCLMLEIAYQAINDSKNEKKYRDKNYKIYASQNENRFEDDLQSLIDKEDFKKFKIVFDKYENQFIHNKNYSDLLYLYEFSVNLFARNILFSKEQVSIQINNIFTNKDSLSVEEKEYFDRLLLHFYFFIGEYSKGLKICERNINISNLKYKIKYYQYKSLNELALGRSNLARQTIDSLLSIAFKVYERNDPRLLPIFSDLIRLNGKSDNTISLSNRILKIIYDAKLDNDPESVGLWLSIGDAALRIDNKIDALKYFLKSLSILENENFKNPFYYYTCLLSLSKIHILLNDFGQSKFYLNKARRFIDSMNSNKNIANYDYYRIEALFNFYQDKFLDSKTSYEKAYTYFKDNSFNDEILYLIATYFVNNDIDKIYKELIKHRNDNHDNYFFNILYYFISYNRGDKDEAKKILIEFLTKNISETKNYFNLISNDEKEQFFRTNSFYFEFLNTYLLEKDTLFLEQYIPLRFYIKSILKSSTYNSNYNTNLKLSLVEEYRSNINQINRLINEEKIDNHTLSELRSRNREIERLIPKKIGELNIPTLSNLRNRLNANEALIEIIKINKQSKNNVYKSTDLVKFLSDSIFYGAILITKNSSPKFILIDSVNSLEYIYQTNIRSNIIYKEDEQSSYKIFFEKIDKELIGIQKLYIINDGIYNSINIESLYNTHRKEYVFDYLRISYIQSVNSLFDNQPDSVGIDKPFAYLIGNPNFNTYINQNIDESNLLERGVDDSTLYKIKNTIKLTSLPGTKKEINSIYEILKNNDYKVLSYMYDSANEKNIKNIQSPFLLHIATHGYFLPNDKLSKMKESIFNIHNKINGDDPYFKSGLLLAGAQNTINKKFSNNEDNGILTAVEVKELYLKNTELVVLSACETGLGVNFVGEGMIGLPRAFMIAGAKSVIMSLWSVSDEKTQELMVLFYTNFITKKMNKQDALYYAKKEIKSKYNRPFYWGAFVLID